MENLYRCAATAKIVVPSEAAERQGILVVSFYWFPDAIPVRRPRVINNEVPIRLLNSLNVSR
jgi:hypothetical protein